MTEAISTPDLAAIKRRQQATWAAGDYHMIGTTIVIVAEQLLEAIDVRAGQRVLDVATGSGNAALAAARRGCRAVGLDYVPALLDRARRRAEAEALEVEFVEGDAEALPFDDGEFDVVTSVFGTMFAPDHRRTAAELARVCRPGGKIGLANHTPDGFIGQLFKVNARHVPPSAGVQPPVLWGTESHLRELFGDAIGDLRLTRRQWVARYSSSAAYLEYWRRYYGPTMKAYEALDPEAQTALTGDILDLVGRFNRADDGTMAVPSEYLEVVITRR